MIKARAHEEKIIGAIRKHVPMLPESWGVGIGDDTALLNLQKLSKKQLVITTDSLAEDVHFNWKLSTPKEVAVKLFQMNASDILAKGGSPLFALLNLNLSKNFALNTNFVLSFIKSLGKEMKNKQVFLIGGDVTSSPACVFTMTLMGEVDKFIPRRNSSIKKGDLLVLTGGIGGSKYALEKLKSQENNLPLKIRRLYTAPQAQWKTQECLCKSGVLANIDTSDSLYESLMILSKENKISLKINLDKIRVPSFLREYKFEKILSYLLGSGEDFAMLSVVSQKTKEKCVKNKMQIIGEVYSIKKPEILFYYKENKIEINEDDFNLFGHF
ncbi:MAG: thiamine-phosphate kinase [Spirochaetia bacterium]|nr:thiamine-phosphate kinase [Spirochaetia bacterium]